MNHPKDGYQFFVFAYNITLVDCCDENEIENILFSMIVADRLYRSVGLWFDFGKQVK